VVDHDRCAHKVDPAAWGGRWNGTRPFDRSDPFLHRGPTSVRFDVVNATTLHVTEGVGAAGYEVDIHVDPDGMAARGETSSTVKGTAVHLDGKSAGTTSPVTVATQVSVAACVTANGRLVLWRVLDTTGAGIDSRHERDEVELEHRPKVVTHPTHISVASRSPAASRRSSSTTSR
jgi:hypothetical protein